MQLDNKYNFDNTLKQNNPHMRNIAARIFLSLEFRMDYAITTHYFDYIFINREKQLLFIGKDKYVTA